VTSEQDWRRKIDPAGRRMSLEGTEALELYLAQIEQNLAALAEQMAILQTACAEREELLRRTVACLAERDELLREIEFNQTIVQWIV
jgi:hypothetical protein